MRPPPYVLVVEDDDSTREAMLTVLELANQAAAGVGNGREALDHLRANRRAALILLDLMMPVMDGWQFRKEQQQDPALAPIPVVVVSADGNVSQKAATLGAAGFLQKPVEVDDLVRMVRRHCLHHGQ
jgi:CheY-like chemotaxis protein